MLFFIDSEEWLPAFTLPGVECTPGGVCRVAGVIHITMQADILVPSEVLKAVCTPAGSALSVHQSMRLIS